MAALQAYMHVLLSTVPLFRLFKAHASIFHMPCKQMKYKQYHNFSAFSISLSAANCLPNPLLHKQLTAA